MMSEELSDIVKYDPSDIKQTFPELNLRVHCCRYWSLTEWECANMAFPFWRLYHNSKGTASIMFKGVTTFLTAGTIVMIPPNTSFSTSLKPSTDKVLKESIVGKKITPQEQMDDVVTGCAADHLFIHFNLGIPYDSLQPGVYTFLVEESTNKLLTEIKEFSMHGTNVFHFANGAAINCLIFSLLKNIPQNKWETPNLDQRIIHCVTYIEQHLHEKLTNVKLSQKANMAKNSFARLFKENTKMTIQHYIQRKRIEKSLILLHHSTSSIEEIADACGFFDRHHFSKVFHDLMNMSPVFYRKHLTF